MIYLLSFTSWLLSLTQGETLQSFFHPRLLPAWDQYRCSCRCLSVSVSVRRGEKKKSRRKYLMHAKSQGQELNPHYDLAPPPPPPSPCVCVCVCVCVRTWLYNSIVPSWITFEDHKPWSKGIFPVYLKRLHAKAASLKKKKKNENSFYINHLYLKKKIIDARLQSSQCTSMPTKLRQMFPLLSHLFIILIQQVSSRKPTLTAFPVRVRWKNRYHFTRTDSCHARQLP